MKKPADVLKVAGEVLPHFEGLTHANCLKVIRIVSICLGIHHVLVDVEDEQEESPE